MSRYLYLAGAVPFLPLGTTHAFATPLHPEKPRGLSPSDPGLVKTMATSSLRLTRRTNMWLAWVGFNLSHSLGVIVFGVLAFLIGRSEASFGAEAPLFGPLAVLVSGAYLVLALKYWFRIPIAGCAVSLVLFLLSWALRT